MKSENVDAWKRGCVKDACQRFYASTVPRFHARTAGTMLLAKSEKCPACHAGIRISPLLPFGARFLRTRECPVAGMAVAKPRRKLLSHRGHRDHREIDREPSSRLKRKRSAELESPLTMCSLSAAMTSAVHHLGGVFFLPSAQVFHDLLEIVLMLCDIRITVPPDFRDDLVLIHSMIPP